MSVWYQSRTFTAVLIAVAVLLLLFFAGQAWLGTGIGRGVVESRLSAALGRPARLDGEFSIGLLPVPRASGTELRLFSRDGRWLVLNAGSYLAKLSLWPLLKGEVEVVALRLDRADIDLARLASEPAPASDPGGPSFQIPDIRSFELADVALYFDGMRSQPHLRISELTVDDFQVDVPAPFEASVSVVSGQVEQAGFSANGSLTLWSRGMAEVELSKLDVAFNGWSARGLEGDLEADIGQSSLEVGLRWQTPEQAFGVAAQITWKPEYAGAQSGYEIEALEFTIGEERLAGAGCLLDGSPPVLHLALSSEALNLDALETLAQHWQVPAGGRDAAAQPAVGTGEGLPFDLAFLLVVDRAIYEGAVAEGIRLRAGERPQCPERHGWREDGDAT